MTELGLTLHPLARNTPASFSLTKGLPVPKLMGVTSPHVVLGTHLFTVEIYVAPIEDMLLGLDFLEANGVPLQLKEKELQISGDVIPMSLGTGSPLVNEKEALYSDSLYVRTHLFCIGQNFPLLYFYIVIRYVN
jgi:hypothetical protein